MISVIFPLLAALAFAVATTFVRKDLGKSNFVSAALSVSLIGNIIIWPFALFSTNLKTVNLLGILFFAAAGLLTQGITQLLYFKGIEAVGASVTASVYATYPIYSSLLAVLLLSEALSTGNWIGILCMFFGIILVQAILGVNLKRF
jgi:drug/metabolite transporter (DMT)-like permease